MLTGDFQTLEALFFILFSLGFGLSRINLKFDVWL